MDRLYWMVVVGKVITVLTSDENTDIFVNNLLTVNNVFKTQCFLFS